MHSGYGVIVTIVYCAAIVAMVHDAAIVDGYGSKGKYKILEKAIYMVTPWLLLFYFLTILTTYNKTEYTFYR